MPQFGEESGYNYQLLKNATYGLEALKNALDSMASDLSGVPSDVSGMVTSVAAIKAKTDLLAAHSDESGSFLWDTSVYTTTETDVSALFTTPLTGTKRRRISVYLDLTGPAGDAAAWTKLTVNVKVKIDGSNYRTVDQKEIAKADVAAAKEPGVPIDIPAVAQAVQITFTFDVALGADQTIYYHTVTEALEA